MIAWTKYRKRNEIFFRRLDYHKMIGWTKCSTPRCTENTCSSAAPRCYKSVVGTRSAGLLSTQVRNVKRLQIDMKNICSQEKSCVYIIYILGNQRRDIGSPHWFLKKIIILKKIYIVVDIYIYIEQKDVYFNQKHIASIKLKKITALFHQFIFRMMFSVTRLFPP